MASGGSEEKTTNPHPPSASAPPRLSIFDLPTDFFDSCRLLSSSGDVPISLPSGYGASSAPLAASSSGAAEGEEGNGQRVVTRWTCNTCKAEFESLLEQRSHFKSDFHRLNVKLHMAGKDTIKEELFDELGGATLFEECDISSVSGSEDESENELQPRMGMLAKGKEATNQKIHVHLQSGNIISLWSCMVLHESEFISFESTSDAKEENRSMVMEDDLVKRLKGIIHEPRNKSHFRIVLLLSGGHFAACVFDGNSIIAHKTFHRYVVRAKSGKRQSTKDATGKVAHSAGSALRRYNEAALKKDIQDLLVTWKPYFMASSCILVHAPSRNSELLFGGVNAILTRQHLAVRNIPLTVRRPTFKEAKRVYSHLVHVTYAINDECPTAEEKKVLSTELSTDDLVSSRNSSWRSVAEEKKFSQRKEYGDPPVSEEVKRMDLSADLNDGTLLHEAAKSGDPQRIFELLEQGLDPCIKDSRGRTPYMLASDKEVRNTFRRFMALNLDKWDWHAANVPSPLTKEMEESQAAKQAEKDAKRKAKAKELKKLRKAREKAQISQPATSQDTAAASKSLEAEKTVVAKAPLLPNRRPIYSAEELRKQTLDAEREKRAAAAERRIAALNAAAAATAANQETTRSVQDPKGLAIAIPDGTLCSCCNSSLAGKVPFHRYHYKYCSTTCMHVHREMLEDG